MITIETLYIIATIASITASIPQVRQLLISKRSDELSPITWGVWTVSQSVSLLYVTSIGQTMLMVASSIWVIFNATMLYLILYYRKYPDGIRDDITSQIIESEPL